MGIPTIDELHNELTELVKGVAAFGKSGFSVFDADDLVFQSTHQTYPTAGVAYDGAIPINKAQGNEAKPVAMGASAVTMITIQFTIIIAIQYNYGDGQDTKPQATGLLDDVRGKVHGYKGANGRPWMFIGEKPETAASGDGLALYSQTWQTVVPAVGNFNHA